MQHSAASGRQSRVSGYKGGPAHSPRNGDVRDDFLRKCTPDRPRHFTGQQLRPVAAHRREWRRSFHQSQNPVACFFRRRLFRLQAGIVGEQILTRRHLQHQFA